MHGKSLAFVIVGFIATPMMAHASITAYRGLDDGAAVTGPFTSSDNAASAFDTAAGALGTVNLINFESAPVGAFSSISIAPGVSLSGSDYQGNNQTILDTLAPPAPGCPAGGENLCGFNVTPGGDQYAYAYGGSLTFTFATPIQAFAAYFTGVQTGRLRSITFNDGSAMELFLQANNDGGAQFLGFTDPGKSISSITFNAGVDFIGLDDVRYVSSPVPLPAAAWLLLSGLGGLGFLRRRKAA